MIARVFDSSGSSGRLTFQMIDVSSQIDNNTRNFVLPTFKKGSLLVFYNGLAQRLGSEIVELSNTTFQTSFVPPTGTSLLVFYQPL